MAASRQARGRRAVALALAAALTGGVAACEYDRTTIAQQAPQIAVHAVLNPGAARTFILVEYVLGGRVTVRQSQSFDVADPIVSGGGEPVRGARVVVYGPNETDSAVAIEGTTSGSTRGQGVYRLETSSACGPLQPNCIELSPGATYRLRLTHQGHVVTGTTTIPSAIPLNAGPQIAILFDRERDTLALGWREIEGARRYALRIESPRGPFNIFLADTLYRVAGTLRNPLELTLPSVFMPGFVQGVTVAAVDSNYFDYFRSSNNPFTGTGLINRLEGGIGVFGSWVLMVQRAVSVTAPVDQPIEGRYGRAAPGFFPPDVRLWVESTDNGTSYLSGRYFADGEATPRGVLGLLAGTDVTLVFLQDQLASDTIAVFRGTLQSDGSIAGSVPGRGTQRLVKLP